MDFGLPPALNWDGSQTQQQIECIHLQPSLLYIQITTGKDQVLAAGVILPIASLTFPILVGSPRLFDLHLLSPIPIS